MTNTLIVLHAVFLAVAFAALAFLPWPTQQMVAALVVAYNLIIPAYGLLSGSRETWLRWRFLLPLSLLMVMPDRVLVEALHLLRFPQAPMMLGGVPAHMAGMWVIPLFIITAATDRWAPGGEKFASLCIAAVLGLLVFGAAEYFAPWVPLWSPRNVDLYAGVALYILPAEMLLAAATWYCWDRYRDAGIFVSVVCGIVLMLGYTGAAAIGHLLINL